MFDGGMLQYQYVIKAFKSQESIEWINRSSIYSVTKILFIPPYYMVEVKLIHYVEITRKLNCQVKI